MKTCAICRAESVDEAPSCPSCGEASWLEATTQSAELSPSTDADTGEVNGDEPEAAAVEDAPAAANSKRARKAR